MKDYLTLPKDLLSNDDVETIEFILNEGREIDEIARLYNPLERKTQELCKKFQVSSIEEVLKAAIKYGLVNCKRDDDYKTAIFKQATKNYLSDIQYRQKVFSIYYDMPQIVTNCFNDMHCCVEVLDKDTFNKVCKELKENKQAMDFFEKLHKQFDFNNFINCRKSSLLSKINFQNTISQTL